MTEYAWFDLGNGRQVFRKVPSGPAPAVSDLPAPQIITDSVEVKSMVDGKIYTSKSALRRSYREKGYIEVGNEKLTPPPKPKPDRKKISESVGRAFSRVGIPA